MSDQPKPKMQLKMSRPMFALIIAIVTAATGFATFLVQYYVHDPALSTATVLFITGIASPVITYLTTEEASLPPAP